MSDEDLPTIWDLYGREPDATGEMSSEDFVRRLRADGWRLTIPRDSDSDTGEGDG